MKNDNKKYCIYNNKKINDKSFNLWIYKLCKLLR